MDGTGERFQASISYHLVDPELLPVLDARLAAMELSDETLAAVREAFDSSAFDAGLASGVSLKEVHIEGPEGAPAVRLLVLTPDGLQANAPVLFLIHGGGYVLGAPEDTLGLASQLAKTCGCVSILPGYRLAPEAQWPAPIDDLYAALEWVYHNADDLGADPFRIVVAGISAGGGHAAALSLRARDRGGPAILHQMLICPMLDDRQPESRFAGEFGWTRQADRYGWASLLGQAPGMPDVPEEAVPGRVRDLSNLPPTFITIGALDLFVESALSFSQRLIVAGVPTELHIYPGSFHGFEFVVPEAAISQASQANVTRVLQLIFSRAQPAS